MYNLVRLLYDRKGIIISPFMKRSFKRHFCVEDFGLKASTVNVLVGACSGVPFVARGLLFVLKEPEIVLRYSAAKASEALYCGLDSPKTDFALARFAMMIIYSFRVNSIELFEDI